MTCFGPSCKGPGLQDKFQMQSSMKSTPTYLITGGAGFIGSHLSETLLARGNRVLVIDDLSTGRMENIESLVDHPQFQFSRASITDGVVMDRLASQADIIVHLAAAVGVKLIVVQPVHTIETNIMGTEAVLKAALRYNCRDSLLSPHFYAIADPAHPLWRGLLERE